ncbi:hypothetical protein T07_419 [Trichinella nelsoni]|uniref:Uncharacterized protein n=1 Tax=Trichinella nelsoni TaxID=6336 RepID=A0A0V0RI74_9BILA|nr:hypothetical protein T07_419 [Trichinella nelsoni]
MYIVLGTKIADCSDRGREARGIALRLRPRANKNLHIPSGYAPGVLLHHIWPQAPGFALRLCPRANKNLHITLRGYACGLPRKAQNLRFRL